MTRVIYSIYIDIPKSQLDDQLPFQGESINKNFKAKDNFKASVDWLADMQREYARECEAEYRLYQGGVVWGAYYNDMKTRYPFLTTYLIINFYKIHLLYELAHEFDEVLYMDLDVIPITSENFFEAWNLNEGIAIQKLPASDIVRSTYHMKKRAVRITSNRSPEAKYWNTYAMLTDTHFEPDQPVYNTGIIGATKEHLDTLAYFDTFDEDMAFMSELVTNPDDMFMQWQIDSFGWDNETLWGYKSVVNEVIEQQLDGRWHYVMDRHKTIPPNTHLVHAITKEFEFVRKWYEKNRLQHME